MSGPIHVTCDTILQTPEEIPLSSRFLNNPKFSSVQSRPKKRFVKRHPHNSVAGWNELRLFYVGKFYVVCERVIKPRLNIYFIVTAATDVPTYVRRALTNVAGRDAVGGTPRASELNK